MFTSCASDDNYVVLENNQSEPDTEQTSPVNYDLEAFPYQTLSEYNFFNGELKNLDPVYGVLPYTLNSTLFSDYAHKKRFVWMPNSVQANYVSDGEIINFPVGTILIKNFYYEHVLPNNETKIIETRLMIRKSEGWIFADYVWNEEQDEANFDLNGSVLNLDWQENGSTHSVSYRIPSEYECHTCHKTGDVSIPIGPKPRNLNISYDYNGEIKNQLEKWNQQGYLEATYPNSITTLPSWEDGSLTLEERTRAYLEINCAHCHSEESHCAYRPMRFSFEDTADPVNIGVCVEPDTDIGEGTTHIVFPGRKEFSVLYHRINTTEESRRMPLMGRTLLHEEGITLIGDWIDSLNIECE